MRNNTSRHEPPDATFSPTAFAIGESFAAVGIDTATQPLKVVGLVDHSTSMANRYFDGDVAQSLQVTAALIEAARSGTAPVAFFNSKVIQAKNRINPQGFNAERWLRDNRPQSMGTTNLAAAAIHTIRVVATELNTPAVADVATMPLNRLRPVQASQAGLAIATLDGGADNEEDAIKAFRRSSYVPLFWGIIFVGHEPQGERFVNRLEKGTGGLCNNVSVARVDSLRDIRGDNIVGEVFKGLPEWLRQAPQRQLLSKPPKHRRRFRR